MEAFAGERVEESGRVADEQPARTVAPRDAVAERGGPSIGSQRSGARQSTGSSPRGRDGREDGFDRSLGAVCT